MGIASVDGSEGFDEVVGMWGEGEGGEDSNDPDDTVSTCTISIPSSHHIDDHTRIIACQTR